MCASSLRRQQNRNSRSMHCTSTVTRAQTLKICFLVARRSSECIQREKCMCTDKHIRTVFPKMVSKRAHVLEKRVRISLTLSRRAAVQFPSADSESFIQPHP